MSLTAIEFFQRHDAINVYDYLWPCDLLSLSSTSKDLRASINSHCAGFKSIEKKPKKIPPVCRMVRWWKNHCFSCKEQIEPKQCIDNKKRDVFLPSWLKSNNLTVCFECKKTHPLMIKLTKTDAKARYNLTDTEVMTIPHEIKTNPRYRSAASMNLFYETDVQSAALSKFKLSSLPELLKFLQDRKTKQTSRIEQIRRNKQLSKDQRRSELTSELEKAGLELRADSQIADWYITNSKRAHTLEKSVELIRRAHIVHQHVGEYYRRLLDRTYESLKEERYDHDVWSDLWQQGKLRAEDVALKLFAKAKANESLVAESECKCGEPIFKTEDLKTLY